MLFFSTNLKAEPVSFREALLKGLAPDKGLYMPGEIPSLSPDLVSSFSEMEYHEIAFEIISRFLGNEIPEAELRAMTKDAYNFDIPLEKVIDGKFVMRLDQGPTASFKDFAARMMGRMMQYFLKKENRRLLILTATSGDTGSAIANAFYGLDNINVVVLFPDGEVTARQRMQMTTLGRNVNILALDAKFDDCQALVKEAFSDPDLYYLDLSSANSINIGRLVPQIVYYFYAFSKLRSGRQDDDIVFSVPSGNFGDMMGGILAGKMGLPVHKYIVATNENDEFPVFLESGRYQKIMPSINCISSAMNVGHPSNLARLITLYGGNMDELGYVGKMPDMEMMRADIFSLSIDDDHTRKTIVDVYKNYGVILEPHGAVGWAGLQGYLDKEGNENTLCVSLETAHPAKFPEHIMELLGLDPELPPSLKSIEEKEEEYGYLKNDYSSFKEYLRTNYS